MSRLKGGTVADRTTETWSGRPAFILASIGAAVGLGNIWKFPYTLGNSGGSAFVLIYVLAMLLIATPIMLSEMIIGRHARMSAPSALRTVAVENGSSLWWQAVGWMGQLVQLLVLSFYSVIAGWALAYILKAVSGEFTGQSAEQVGALFDNFVANPGELMFWHSMFMVMTMLVVARGVKKGLEIIVEDISKPFVLHEKNDYGVYLRQLSPSLTHPKSLCRNLLGSLEKRVRGPRRRPRGRSRVDRLGRSRSPHPRPTPARCPARSRRRGGDRFRHAQSKNRGRVA